MKAAIAWYRLLAYSNFAAIALSILLAVAVVLIVFSTQNLVTPRQKKRIRKLKLARFTEDTTPQKKKRLGLNEALNKLIIEAGFTESIKQAKEVLKVFAILTFVLSLLLAFMLGFPIISSVIFAVVSIGLSPAIPILALVYLRNGRNALIVDEIYIMMSHIVEAIETAGKPLKSAIEESLYATPVLKPYMVKFLNTYLAIGLGEAVQNLQASIPMEEMGLFLDILAHGFQHTTNELTRYFQSESDAYHELEIAAKQRRIERREVLFDVLIVFPFAIGFLLLIYPIFMSGMRAITHAI